VSSGFRYVLAGACAIALLFVALSLSPYLRQMDIVWPQPAPAQQQPAPAPPHALSSAAPPSAPVNGAPAGVAQHLPSRVVLQSPAQGAQLAVDEPDSTQPAQWLLTVDNAIVRKEPGGDPFLAPSVSHAPLTVSSGSYLREVRREHGWVLILSPSKTLGWVHERQVRPASM
jgi:hypothetical protein